MKLLKSIGMVAGVLVMCGAFAYAGSMLSHWGEPVHASQTAAAKPVAQKTESSLQKAAVATAQEATELPQ